MLPNLKPVPGLYTSIERAFKGVLVQHSGQEYGYKVQAELVAIGEDRTKAARALGCATAINTAAFARTSMQSQRPVPQTPQQYAATNMQAST